MSINSIYPTTRNIKDEKNGKSLDVINKEFQDIGISTDAHLALLAGMFSTQMMNVDRNIENLTFESGQVTVTTTEDWPFNNPSASVSLKKNRNVVDYIVLAYADGIDAGKSVKIKDRLLNGFKIEVDNCPKSGLIVKYFVIGGMM